tara:strand:+ start:280 stop:564 length:285 start_codon:yes stop_codon:yes gene_type:complete
MICLHCRKKFLFKDDDIVSDTCPHYAKGLEGYTQRTTKETLNELERREVKVDDPVKFSLALNRMACGCGPAGLIIVLLFFVLVFIIAMLFQPIA